MTRLIVTNDGGSATRVRAGQHSLSADEPETAGGTDSGLNPYELLLASLGSCIAMTLRMYADRKQWPLERVEVTLEHDRVHAQDSADCEASDVRLDRIRKDLVLNGPLDDTQRAKLAAIAERCPVNLTLKREVLMEQRLAGGLG